MSLEQAIKELTVQVTRQNDNLEKMLATASASKTATADVKTPAKTPAKAAAAKTPAKTPAKAAAKKTTVDDIAKAFGGYLKTGDSEAREAAKANVKSIVDYFGVAKATAISEDDWAEALGYLAQFEAGEEVEFSGGEEGGEEEEEEEALV